MKETTRFNLSILLFFLSLTCICSAPSAFTFEEAESLLEKGQYLEAIYAFTTLSENGGMNRDEAIEQVADIYNIFLDDPINSKKYYSIIIDEFPHSEFRDDALYNLAFIELDNGNINEGKRLLKELVIQHPESPRKPTAAFFLKRLNKGTSIQRPKGSFEINSGQKVRVLLEKDNSTITVITSGPFRITDITGNEIFDEPYRRSKILFSYSEAGKILIGQTATRENEVLVIPEDGYAFAYLNRRYGGTARISLNAGGLSITNVIGVEEYLKGVIPSEMPASWPKEALKAQAVIARTYVLFQCSKRRSYDFDVYNSVNSQVYAGLSAETKKTTDAANSTRGIVLEHDGKLALTYYHSNSGGFVEDDKNVWKTDLPYLASLKDDFSLEEITNDWAYRLDRENICFLMSSKGKNAKFEIVERFPSGRIKSIEMKCGNHSQKMSGYNFRMSMGPMKIKSCLFDIRNDNGVYVISGKGFGHGVGLSQYGAKNMSEKGFTYDRILTYYYPGTSLKKIYD